MSSHIDPSPKEPRETTGNEKLVNLILIQEGFPLHSKNEPVEVTGIAENKQTNKQKKARIR